MIVVWRGYSDPGSGEPLRKSIPQEVVPEGNCAEASAAAKLHRDIINSVDYMYLRPGVFSEWKDETDGE